MKSIIHINQHIIKANSKNGTKNPVITVKNYKENKYGSNVQILDKNGEMVAEIVYSPDKPLSCGARVWINTYNDVLIK